MVLFGACALIFLIKAHIKIETGLNRLGVKCGEELAALRETILELPELEIEGMYTHLGNAYSLDKSYTHFQLEQFERAVAQVREKGIDPQLIHVANTGATVGSPEAHYDMIRTEYGFHLMYYVGDSDTTFRDYMVSADMREADITSWYEGLVASAEFEAKNLTLVNMAIVLRG